MKPKSWVGLPVALAAGALVLSGPFACNSSAGLSGPGAACIQVTDCQDGLICCNETKGTFTCMSSVSCLQPGGAGGATATGTDAGQRDAATGDDATQETPGQDGALQQSEGGEPPEADVPETKVEPPMDAGPNEETGSGEEAAPPPSEDAAGPDVTGD